MKTSILAITMSSLILLGGCTGLPGGFLFGPVDHLTVTPGDDFELAETSKGDQEQLIQENVCNAFNFLDPVYFAGLSPAPPVAACTQSLNNETDTVPEHLLSANPNFFSTLYTALYVSGSKGQKSFEQLQTREELHARYLPIDSAQEALSFVLLQQGNMDVLHAKSIKDFSGRLEAVTYFKSEIKGTYLEKMPDQSGYFVRHILQDGDCNARSTEVTAYSVDFSVSLDGAIKEVSRTPLYTQTNCPIA